MIGSTNDDADPFRLDPQSIIMKVHAPSEELIPLRYVWQMKTLPVITAN